MKIRLISLAALLFAPLVLDAEEEWMPRTDDYTQMWWAEGFPSHTPTAPWVRSVQTGYYGFALDAETLRIPHFGPVGGGVPYEQAVSGDNGAIQGLPPAELDLQVTVDGTVYRCVGGGKWTRFTGPRLIESGRFFQRGDVTDLVFESEAGQRLNVEARFETAAWADRLGLILSARPGMQAISAGETSFGRVGGGFGLDGENHFEIPHRPEIDPAQFTLELWAFVPVDNRASERVWPWLVCKNSNEAADGNFGMMVVDGKVQARMNVGGGKDNQFTVESNPLNLGAWNHLAMSYDGGVLRLYANGRPAGEQEIGRERKPGDRGLAFGRRQDNFGDGYHFRGVVDEIRIYDRALTAGEVRQRFTKPDAELKSVAEWSFRADGTASAEKIRESWKEVMLEIGLATKEGTLRQRSNGDEVFLAFDPVTLGEEKLESAVIVGAGDRPVGYEPALGWHRINLDGVEPILPGGNADKKNDAVERIKFTLSNPTDREQVARLLFEKTAQGIRQRIGSPITGVTAVLRDAEGSPIGIPVQLSKNWHNDPQGGVYSGAWFHGISQVRLPAGSNVELELTLAYGHWGGVAAASHSQLCLIGWGSNQLWDQSALGSWGESICYEPDQVQANCTITDVRPLMVRSMGTTSEWGWTNNVGGGDFFRYFDVDGERVAPTAMRTAYLRQGPCLTEVTYAGKMGEGMRQSATVSLARSDDVVRGTYRIRLDVDKAMEFSRFVLFQIGADTYSSTRERKMAVGDESGLIKEWDAQWGGEAYKMGPLELSGRIPWISLHECDPFAIDQPGAQANRGMVIRSWKAKIGGKEVCPWIAERGLTRHRNDSSTLDVIPPPGVTRFEPGDFVEATIEHIVVPQFAKDYYGPNEALRAALVKDENTWRMIFREALGNDRKVEVTEGEWERLYPDVRIRTDGGSGGFKISGGLGYVPVTFTGLSSWRGYQVLLDGVPLDQSVQGSDFWQTDYDPSTRTWSRSYNIPIEGAQVVKIEPLPK